MRVLSYILPLATMMLGGAALANWLWFSVPPREAMRLPVIEEPMVASSGPVVPERMAGVLTVGVGVPGRQGGSWPGFRGAELDGISRDATPLARAWPAAGPARLWGLELGLGYAGAAVHKGRVYVLDYIAPPDTPTPVAAPPRDAGVSPALNVPSARTGGDESTLPQDAGKPALHSLGEAGMPASREGETPSPREPAAPEFGDALRCLSLDDGREIWRYVYPVAVKVNHGQSRTVPAVNDRYVVSLGPKCHVICLDAVTGQLLWAKDLRDEFGTTEPQWYAGQCPIIDGDRVILAPAGPDVLMMAVDLATGRVLWKTPNPMKWRMTHVSIVPMEFAGRRMFVYCGSGGMAGVSSDEGRILWQTTEWKIAVATVPTPVVLPEGRLLCTGDYKAGSAMFQLAESGGKLTIRRLWRLPSEQFASRQHTPVYYDGYLYAVRPDGLLTCLHPDGRVVWTSGSDTFGLGPLLISSQGLIYALDDDGLMVLAEATPQGYRPLARAKILPGGECWAPLALSDGLLIARDIRRMVCLDIRANE